MNYADPWEQLPDEPDKWFGRFDTYAKELGVNFTVKRAWNSFLLDCVKHKNAIDESILMWADIAKKYRWAERAKAWQVEDREIARARWDLRRFELAENDWGVGAKMRDLATQFLSAFTVMKEVGQDKDGNTLLAINASLRDVTTLMKTASEIQRLAMGEPTLIEGKADHIGPAIYLPAIGGDTSVQSTHQSGGADKVDGSGDQRGNTDRPDLCDGGGDSSATS